MTKALIGIKVGDTFNGRALLEDGDNAGTDLFALLVRDGASKVGETLLGQDSWGWLAPWMPNIDGATPDRFADVFDPARHAFTFSEGQENAGLNPIPGYGASGDDPYEVESAYNGVFGEDLLTVENGDDDDLTRFLFEYAYVIEDRGDHAVLATYKANVGGFTLSHTTEV